MFLNNSDFKTVAGMFYKTGLVKSETTLDISTKYIIVQLFIT